ncbi:hypothetical protein BH09PAT1_BH09PAT1_1130 [soil metagenome]
MTLPRLKKNQSVIYTKEISGEKIQAHGYRKYPFLTQRVWSYVTLGLSAFCLVLVILLGMSNSQLISPLMDPLHSLTKTQVKNSGHEVFGFGPYWTINKLDNVDFNVLTTFSYFGVPVLGDGSLDRSDNGYTVFQGKKATEIFKKAHAHGTRVVLTLTQMDNDTLDSLLSDNQAQSNAINEAVSEVKNRGIDGINVDFEYVGNPGSEERTAFSNFVKNLTTKMHQEVPSSKVTVYVYASAATSNRLTDITALAKNSDGIFMMAYDFAVANSEIAMPTAPLYGKKEGKYSYDVSTAVDDFLAKMPANKLILGVPYYGYNYMVSKPGANVPTLPPLGTAQTVEYASENIEATQSGWDETSEVGWKAYYDAPNGVWRVLYQDDAKSLGIKYDYALSKNLGGVGIWALGFDNGTNNLWAVLQDKFGSKNIADARIVNRSINESE